MILIEGSEISANGPHILQIGIGKPVRPENDRQKVIDRITKQGALAIINHPNWQSHFNHCPQKLLQAWQGYTGLEIYNGVIERLAGSPLATDRWDMLLSEGRRVWGFGNDDSHRPEDTGLAWNIVWARRHSKKGILDALVQGSFYASTGVEITDIRVHGRTLEVKTSNAQKMIVVTDGGQEVAKKDGKRIAYTLAGMVGTYIRIECIGNAGTKAWTQPFFIEGGSSGTKPPKTKVHMVSRPVRMTGSADDPLWKKAEVLSPYVSLGSAEPVKYKTVTRLLCDRKYIYAAFECDHPDPSNLKTAAAKGKSHSLYTDDSVELFARIHLRRSARHLYWTGPGANSGL